MVRHRDSRCREYIPAQDMSGRVFGGSSGRRPRSFRAAARRLQVLRQFTPQHLHYTPGTVVPSRLQEVGDGRDRTDRWVTLGMGGTDSTPASVWGICSELRCVVAAPCLPTNGRCHASCCARGLRRRRWEGLSGSAGGTACAAVPFAPGCGGWAVVTPALLLPCLANRTCCSTRGRPHHVADACIVRRVRHVVASHVACAGRVSARLHFA